MDYTALLVSRYPMLETIQAAVHRAYQLMRDCYRGGGKLLVAGNGGSAADAEHIVGELMKSFLLPRPLDGALQARLWEYGERGGALAATLQKPLPAIALTGHISLTTAYHNDADPDMAFAQQLLGYGRQGDIFLAISTSGNSKNVVYAAMAAKALDIKVVGLTGADGGRLGDLADVAVRAPAKETYLIQELHLPVYHCWCAMLEENFFGN